MHKCNIRWIFSSKLKVNRLCLINTEYKQQRTAKSKVPLWIPSVWNSTFLSPSPSPHLHPLPLLKSSGAGLTRAVLQLAALVCAQEHKACQWRTAVCQPVSAEREGQIGVGQPAWQFKPDDLEWRTVLLSLWGVRMHTQTQWLLLFPPVSALGSRVPAEREQEIV